MALLATWLAAVGLADIVRWDVAAGWRRVGAATVAGITLMIVLCWLGALTVTDAVSFIVPGALALAGWLVWSKLAIAPGARARGVTAPIALLGLAVIGLAAASGHSPEFGGRLASWYDRLGVTALHGVSLDRFLLGAAALIFLQCSANAVVRLILTAAGTAPDQSGSTLKGGRVLGAMERSFIFALGLAGDLTAASIIVAAKGLLRFPEIRDKTAEAPGGAGAPGVDALTEYFLVGSLASWLLALAFLPLLRS